MVEAAALAEDKCFITATKQMRKIVKIDGGKVTYETWSARQERPMNPARYTVSDTKFCGDVDKEVPCSHRDGFGGA